MAGATLEIIETSLPNVLPIKPRVVIAALRDAPGDDRGVLWNDPEIAIDRSTPAQLSCKGSAYLLLSQISGDRLPPYQS
jgi:hypothetical protein